MITRHRAADSMARHRHAQAYVAVVLAGDYIEAGDGGRVRARPGTVIAHAPFGAHRDEFGANGATVLNLPGVEAISGTGTVDDVDALVRAAERDLSEAVHLLGEQFRPHQVTPDDWPDQLAAALSSDPDLAIADWAERMGLAAASISRGFARAYGVSPKRFRLEARAQRAMRSLPSWHGTLASLAADQGFADQAHLARTVRAITGVAPRALRAKSVQV